MTDEQLKALTELGAQVLDALERIVDTLEKIQFNQEFYQ